MLSAPDTGARYHVGPFSVSFRAYWPSEPIVLGGAGWHLPPVQEP